jgi:hypothetical protein
MDRHVRAAALVALALACALPAGAEDSMRCGSHLVSTGDGRDKVRTLCGDPQDVTFIGLIGRRGSPTYRSYDYTWFGPAWIELPVEVWTYNFGPNKLLRKLRFEGDELVKIDTAGYGY